MNENKKEQALRKVLEAAKKYDKSLDNLQKITKENFEEIDELFEEIKDEKTTKTVS